MKRTITVKEAAALLGCSEQYIRKCIAEGKLKAQEVRSGANGRNQYALEVDALPADIRAAYDVAQVRGVRQKRRPGEGTRPMRRQLDEFSAREREEIRFWAQVCAEWASRGVESGSKVAALDAYVEEVRAKRGAEIAALGLRVSRRIIYKRLAAWREGDLEGLVDGRGKANRGRTSIAPEIWDVFLLYWLDERQPSISMCYGLVREYLMEFAEEFPPAALETLPSVWTFQRHVERDISQSIRVYGRLGEKAYTDRCLPYNERLYGSLASNDYWIADNYTLDAISQGEDGTRHRLHLTAFQDARSGVITGMFLTDNPSGQATLMALKDGIERCGIPRCVYFDNGREFLCRDIGGRGNRAHSGQHYEYDPPTILEHLGIEMRVAIVRNAKAKPIERTFRTVKETVMKLLATYCGGNVLERPESLKYRLKQGDVPTDSRLREILRELIESRYNQAAYGGSVRGDRGKTRMEVWQENLTSIRQASQEELALMLMRTARPQTIGRGGAVKLAIAGEELRYMNRITAELQGKRVYLRYDPAHLESVRVYEEATDRYICIAELAVDNMLLFGDTGENVSLAQEKIRQMKKEKRQELEMYKSRVPLERRIDALDLSIRRAHAMGDSRAVAVDVPVELARYTEASYFQEEAPEKIIDIRTMLANAQRKE